MTVAYCMMFDGDNDSLVTEAAGLFYKVEGRRSSSSRSENTDRIWCFEYRQRLDQAFRYLRDAANDNGCHRLTPFHTARTVVGGDST